MNLRRNRGWGAKLGVNNVNIILTWNSQKIKNNFLKKIVAMTSSITVGKSTC